MTTFLPGNVQQDLGHALMAKRKSQSRLRIVAGDRIFPVLSMSRSHFALDADDAPRLRGLVDIFDRGTHLCQALIVASHVDGDTVVFDFKRNTIAASGPALDFERDKSAPVGFITAR